MEERAAVLVRLPVELLRRLDQRTIAAKATKGLAWSRNHELLAILEAALAKHRPSR